MRPYRSDFTGKLRWYVHHRPTTIAVIVLVVALPLSMIINSVLP